MKTIRKVTLEVKVADNVDLTALEKSGGKLDSWSAAIAIANHNLQRNHGVWVDVHEEVRSEDK